MGARPRWRERGRTRRARKDRPPRAAALALEAQRGPCDVRSRASRASTRARRGGPILVWVVPSCGTLRGSCAGTEVSDARGSSVRMHGHPDQALHPLRARATARTRQHALAMPMAFREGLTRCTAGAAHHRPTLTVILTLPSRLHPPRSHSHPRPHRPMARAVGPRLTWRAALDLGSLARRAAASRPRAVHTPCAPARRGRAAACGLRSAACDPCYEKAAWATCWH